jgi:hypothetical protein
LLEEFVNRIFEFVGLNQCIDTIGYSIVELTTLLFPVQLYHEFTISSRRSKSYPPVRAHPRRSTMEYVKLGGTGLEVSRICLGCMSYGVPNRGNHAWSIDEAESRPFIK